MAQKGWTKLHANIVNSSLTDEPVEVRYIFQMMCAVKDHMTGEVMSTTAGLARMFNVPVEMIERALKVLMSPDSRSRTPNLLPSECVSEMSALSQKSQKWSKMGIDANNVDTGYRIGKIPGGFLVLNHRKYKEQGRSVDRKEYNRLAKQKSRAKAKAAKEKKKSTIDTDNVSQCQPESANKEVDTNLPIVLNGGASERRPPRTSFQEFWHSFPHPEEVFCRRAEKCWGREHCEVKAEEIMACLSKWDAYWAKSGDSEMAYLWLRRQPWKDDYVGPLDPEPEDPDLPTLEEADRIFGGQHEQ